MTAADLSRQFTRWAVSLSDREVLLLLSGFTALMIFSGIGLRSPWPSDEPRFAEIAREMVESGHWLIPVRGGEYYPDKPPVFFWAIALLYKLTGSLKLAFLLPSALCSLLTASLVFDLGRRLWSRRVAVLSVILLLITPQFLIQAKSAQIDAMVACWITVACYGLMRHFFERPAWGWYFAAWAFMGLGIITKGVGFLPVLLFFPLLYLAFKGEGNEQRERRPWRHAAGPLVMLAVVAAWVVPMALHVERVGTDAALAYRDNILLKQTAERYADTWTHLRPWHYFLTSAIPALWFPLPLLLLAAWRRFVRDVRTQPALFAIVTWVALVLVFFSISPGKRGVYILPALPMAALAVASVIDRQRLAGWFSPVVRSTHMLMAGGLTVLGILALLQHPVMMERLSDYSNDGRQAVQLGWLVLTFGILWLVTLLWRRPHPLIPWSAALMASFLLYSTVGYVLLEPLRTPRDVLLRAEQILPEGAALGLIRFKEQFLLFSPLDVTHFSYLAQVHEQERNAWLWMAGGEHRYLLVPDDITLECFRLEGSRSVGMAHRAEWLIVSDGQRLADCPAPAVRQQFNTQEPGSWLTE